jgi:hypothetical protein
MKASSNLNPHMERRSMQREKWYESDNPGRFVRGGSWRGAVWIVAATVLFGLIGIGIWGFKVTTADVKGRGDAHRQITSADNRLFAQGNFNDLYQEILASDRKLDQAARDKADHPDDSFYATNYTGLMAHCQDTVGQYNSAARKITQERFKDEDLPWQIDNGDPATDCKPKTEPTATTQGSAN